jgi:hypothetical protein
MKPARLFTAISEGKSERAITNPLIAKKEIDPSRKIEGIQKEVEEVVRGNH